MRSSKDKEASQFDYAIKLLLLGDTGVGKSSLLHRYAKGEFIKDFIGTAGVDHLTKNIQHKGKIVKSEAWKEMEEKNPKLALKMMKEAMFKL